MISSSIDVSRVVDLVKCIVGESAKTFGDVLDVKVVDYIAKSLIWVPGYTCDPII